MSQKPKILIFDFETSPAKGYFFGKIWETNIIEVIEYEQILSVSWKWYGEKTTHVIGQDDFKGYKKGVLDDKAIVAHFAPILGSADIVVAHNGDSFDLTVFNTRLLAHRFDPIAPNKSFDTKKISKNKFHLPSNKLDHIADFLGIGRKMAHTGTSMWMGCEKGIEKDWTMMKKYNKLDVILLEKILHIILPYMKQVNDFVTTRHGVTCPNPTCLSTHMIKSKTRRVKDGFKQQYQCKDCGSYWSDSRLIKTLKA